MEPRSSVGHETLLQKSIKRGDLALEKHLQIAREQLTFPGKGQRKAASGREQPTNNAGSRGQGKSSVVKQQERRKEKCLARAKKQERWRNKAFASVRQLSKELKSGLPFRYPQHGFSSRRDSGDLHTWQSMATGLRDPHLPSHPLPGQSQLGHEAVMSLKEAISSNSNL